MVTGGTAQLEDARRLAKGERAARWQQVRLQPLRQPLAPTYSAPSLSYYPQQHNYATPAVTLPPLAALLEAELRRIARCDATVPPLELLQLLVDLPFRSQVLRLRLSVVLIALPRFHTLELFSLS